VVQDGIVNTVDVPFTQVHAMEGDDLVALDRGRFRHYQRTGGGMHWQAGIPLPTDTQRVIGIFTIEGERYILTNHALMSVSSPHPVAEFEMPIVAATLKVDDDKLILTDGDELFMVDGTPMDSPNVGRINTLAWGDGKLWVGGTSGLAMLTTDGWQTFGVADGLPGRAVLDLKATDTHLWIVASGGAAKMTFKNAT
jgi:hypothetical protein